MSLHLPELSRESVACLVSGLLLGLLAGLELHSHTPATTTTQKTREAEVDHVTASNTEHVVAATKQVVYVDRVVTRTEHIAQDGTCTAVTQTREHEHGITHTGTSADSSSHQSTVSVTADSASSKTVSGGRAATYRLGAEYRLDYGHPSTVLTGTTGSHVSVTAGRQLVGPVWLGASWQPSTHELGVGLSVDF